MSVFISYKREDRSVVHPLVEALRAAGLSIWWDQDIPPGAAWEATCQAALESSKAAIVVWSARAIASDAVRDEARWARDRGRLLQTFIEPCAPPLFFGERQGVDLTGWKGDPVDPRFDALLKGLRAIMAGEPPPQGVGFTPAPKPKRAAFVAATALGLASFVPIVTNAGGVRDALCGITGIPACMAEHTSESPTSAPISAEDAMLDARRELLTKVPGAWGLQGADGAASCQVTLRYRIDRNGADDFVVIENPDGSTSSGVVIYAQDGRVLTETVTPAEKAGTRWELEPEASRLIQTDERRNATTLVRCGD